MAVTAAAGRRKPYERCSRSPAASRTVTVRPSLSQSQKPIENVLSEQRSDMCAFAIWAMRSRSSVLRTKTLNGFKKRFEKAVVEKTPAAVEAAARHLHRLERAGLPYHDCLVLLLSSLRLFTTELSARVDSLEERRRRRRYAEETYHLVRARLQCARGVVRLSQNPIFTKGTLDDAVECFVDGSVRNGKAGVGFIVINKGALLVEANVELPVTTPVEAELYALVLCMKTALALGHRAVRISTDAQALVELFFRKKGIAGSTPGREALRLADCLSGFEIQRVPRLFNDRADALAARSTARLVP
ncbi:reverse transcriptase-like protein [Paraburkholderia sp. UCT31]|uniref:reverse transcriptase-like protein n=1 Tax=Paraburkholderia sp. UCT31 TaxID=2615209 RepID=UPI00165646B1|nr:reverse transcriptase-like protein [Paraburkholderia sp. UCT31]MBC8737298.1 reverse transcriptase-like protein [Paraburkholderia sp. UCT31]